MLLLFLFLYLLSLSSYSSAQSSPFDQLIESKKKAVTDVSIALTRQFSPEAWCNAADQCNDSPCFPSACSGDSFGPDYKCTSRITILNQPNTCQGLSHPNDALLNLEQPFLWISADATTNSGDGSNITIRDIALRRDVCASKKFASKLKEAYFEHNITDWLYAGTAFGSMTIFPGVALQRSNGYSSCGFNPVVRPWYISAASGPKDIVFLLDGTTLLQTNNKLFEAFKVTLDTTDRFDHIAVVLFGASTVKPLGADGRKVLQSATAAIREKLLDELDSLPLAGPPNITLAFDAAFDIHQNPSHSSGCSTSKLIVLLSGQQDTCIARCSTQDSCNCVESLRSFIQSRQETFEEAPVSVITFTEGANSDALSANNAERMSRTITCDKKNTGIWRRVTSADTSKTAMSTYSQITAASIFEEDPKIVFSETYIDAGGLGEIFTLSRPVYSVSEKRLLAVIGADITVREVASTVGDEAAARNLIADEALKARSCSRATTRTSCELQTIRSQPSSAMCADVLPASRCYQRGRKVYMPFNETGTWNDARATCAGLENVTATLMKIDNEADNRFVAGFMNADGSWIGLRADLGKEMTWEDGSKPEYQEFAYKAFGVDADTISKEVQNRFAVASCATADRRGLEGNWNIERCSANRGFVCEMKADPNVTTLCDGDVFSYETSDEPPVNDVNCITLASSVRNCNEEETARMEQVNPVCKESNGEFTTRDRICCGGRSDRSGVDDSDSSSSIIPDTTSIWWVWILLGVIVVVVLCCFLWICVRIVRRRREKKKADEEKVQTEIQRRERMLKEQEEKILKATDSVATMVQGFVKGSRTSGHGSGGLESGKASPPPRTVGGDEPSAPPLSPGQGSEIHEDFRDALPESRYDQHYRYSPTQRGGNYPSQMPPSL